MNTSIIIQLTYQALILVLMVSLPVVVVAALTGLIISVLQTITQVQDQSLSQAVKLIMVIVTLVLMSQWAGAELRNFGEQLFALIQG
jgi:type III secretion protein S